MPNWCDNELRIYGPKSERDRLLIFIKRVKSATEPHSEAINNRAKYVNAFDFENVISYPDKFIEQDKLAREERIRVNAMSKLEQDEYYKRYGHNRLKDGYNSGGYEWCCANWGTKWTAHEVAIKENKSSTLISFSTAWSPPHPIIDKLSELFPTLKFSHKFWECGCAYKGKYVHVGGQRLEEIDEPYHGHRGG